jgi:hypothetical protein
MLLIILDANIKLCINNNRIQINFRSFVYFINTFILFMYNTTCNISDSIIIRQRTIVSVNLLLAAMTNIYYYYYMPYIVFNYNIHLK